MLDPEGEDLDEFVRWVIGAGVKGEVTDEIYKQAKSLLEKQSVASFSVIRDELKFARGKKDQDLIWSEMEAIINDFIPPDIALTREFQSLQAQLNCTRQSLLPKPATEADRKKWRERVRELQLQGID